MTDIPPPSARACIAPLLPALGPATASPLPPPAVLPLLSPILRQRVQLLSSGSTEPWIRLLCRDAARAPRLAEMAAGPALEPHPSSGEIEVDWDDGGVDLRVQRVDEETLEALAALGELGLVFRLVYCLAEGGGEGGATETGWRIGEVFAVEGDAFSGFEGVSTVSEAESEFESRSGAKVVVTNPTGDSGVAIDSNNAQADDDNNDDDDDDYWNRYDSTPGGRTPAAPRSPAPGASFSTAPANKSAEDAYFAQYDSVQPAMDPHDPDEAPPPPAVSESESEPAIDFVRQREEENRVRASINGKDARRRLGMGAIVEEEDERVGQDGTGDGPGQNESGLHHPRPGSSGGGSNGSAMVERLEDLAEHQGRSEMGIRSHISNSIRSLHELARAAGIEGGEFKRLVLSGLDGLDGGAVENS